MNTKILLKIFQRLIMIGLFLCATGRVHSQPMYGQIDELSEGLKNLNRQLAQCRQNQNLKLKTSEESCGEKKRIELSNISDIQKFENQRAFIKELANETMEDLLRTYLLTEGTFNKPLGDMSQKEERQKMIEQLFGYLTVPHFGIDRDIADRLHRIAQEVGEKLSQNPQSISKNREKKIKEIEKALNRIKANRVVKEDFLYALAKYADTSYEKPFQEVYPEFKDIFLAEGAKDYKQFYTLLPQITSGLKALSTAEKAEKEKRLNLAAVRNSDSFFHLRGQVQHFFQILGLGEEGASEFETYLTQAPAHEFKDGVGPDLDILLPHRGFIKPGFPSLTSQFVQYLKIKFNTSLPDVFSQEINQEPLLFTPTLRGMIREIDGSRKTSVPQINETHLSEALRDEIQAFQNFARRLSQLKKGDSIEALKSFLLDDPQRVFLHALNDAESVSWICEAYKSIQEDTESKEKWDNRLNHAMAIAGLATLTTGIGKVGLKAAGITYDGAAMLLAARASLAATSTALLLGSLNTGREFMNLTELKDHYKNDTTPRILADLTGDLKEAKTEEKSIFDARISLMGSLLFTSASGGGIRRELQDVKAIQHGKIKNIVDPIRKIEESLFSPPKAKYGITEHGTIYRFKWGRSGEEVVIDIKPKGEPIFRPLYIYPPKMSSEEIKRLGLSHSDIVREQGVILSQHPLVIAAKHYKAEEQEYLKSVRDVISKLKGSETLTPQQENDLSELLRFFINYEGSEASKKIAQKIERDITYIVLGRDGISSLEVAQEMREALRQAMRNLETFRDLH